MGALWSHPGRLLLAVMTIFAFSLSDIFDAIGTFIGTGMRSGIFTTTDNQALDQGAGMNNKMGRA